MTASVHTLDPLSFPLQGKALIEASAGTGKTFTLALLYLRLIIQHGGSRAFNRALLPPEILVVTFTNAATAELRDRIRARLVEAATVFQGKATQDPLLEQLKQQLPEAEHPRAARQLIMAAQWMDESAISTIHAWCYRMLKEHAFDSGSAFEPNLETSEQAWQQQAVEDYWRCAYSQMPLSQLNQVIQCWSSPDELLKPVKQCLDKLAYLPNPPGSATEVLARFNQQHAAELSHIKSTWVSQHYTGQLEALFDQAAKQKAFAARSLNAGHRKSVLDKLAVWLSESDQIDPGIFSGSSWLRMSSLGVSEIWNEGFEPPIDHPACVALGLLKEQLDALPNLKPDLLCHASHWIAERIETVKRHSNSLSQNDLLLRLDAALTSSQGEQLAAAIRKQFPVALVDEFQDTDPVQYRIFRRIYCIANPPEPLGFFMIGDPKQAIYAFRGADIYTYLQARQDSAGHHFTLGTNYRSTEALIQSVNDVFNLGDQRQQGAFLFKTENDNPVPFLAVGAGQTSLQGLQLKGQQVSALQGWFIEKEASKLSKTAANDALSHATAAKIHELLTLAQTGEALLPDENQKGRWRGVRPSDCAVLVNSFSEAQCIRQALQRVGIASVYLSDRSSVFQSWIATEVLQLLRAASDPLNERKIRTALASPLLKLDITELEKLNHDELYWETFSDAFIDYHQRWQRQGVLPLMYSWIQDFNLAAGAGSRDQGERELTDLLHLGELLHQAATTLDGEQALIRYLEEAMLEPDEQSEAQQLRLETDAQLVRVVTIHKSKGLEYPLVFLPFISDSRPTNPKDTLWVTHGIDQAPEVHLRSSAETLEKADQERLAEDLRKLYVALTRARYTNWIGLAATERFSGSALAYVLGATPEDLGDKVSQLSCLHLLTLPDSWPAPWQPENTVAECTARPKPNLQHKPWWIASYSALKHGTQQISESPQQDQLREDVTDASEMAQIFSNTLSNTTEIVKTFHNLPKGSHIGTFLHSLLEWAAQLMWIDANGHRQQGFAGVLAPQLQEHCLAYLTQKCQQRGLDEWIPCVYEWLQQCVQQQWTFPSQLVPNEEPLCLARLTPDQISVEMEFWFASHQVNTKALDHWVTQNTLNGLARSPLAANQLNGLLKGFIDLVVEHQGRYYVIDWKSNWLGENETAYTAIRMRETLLEKRYDLQYVLYLLALHRYLRLRLPDYDYDLHIGGAAYVYLRGYQAESQGVFFDKPDRAMIEGLDRLFAGHDSHDVRVG